MLLFYSIFFWVIKEKLCMKLTNDNFYTIRGKPLLFMWPRRKHHLTVSHTLQHTHNSSMLSVSRLLSTRMLFPSWKQKMDIEADENCPLGSAQTNITCIVVQFHHGKQLHQYRQQLMAVNFGYCVTRVRLL